VTYRRVMYFNGAYIRLSCGHLIWKDEPQYNEWRNGEFTENVKCPYCKGRRRSDGENQSKAEIM